MLKEVMGKKVHPLSKEARELREKQKEELTVEIEKPFHELYGLPEVDPNKTYEFLLTKKTTNKSGYPIVARSQVYDPVENRIRNVRYVPHEESIFEDEQDPDNTPNPEICSFIRDLNSYTLKVPGYKKNLIYTLLLHEECDNGMRKIRNRQLTFKLHDRDAEYKAAFNREQKIQKARDLAFNAPMEDLLPLAYVWRIPCDNPVEKESMIRVKLSHQAKKDPDQFLLAFKDPKFMRKFTIKKAFDQHLITDLIAKNSAHWKTKNDSKKITDVPPGESTVDYLTDWSFSKEGEEFFSTLKRLLE